MATTYTTNYNLGKQEDHANKFDMDVITDNMDVIDGALKTNADATANHAGNSNVHVTAAEKETWGETGGDLTNHMQDHNNPHGNTAAQVGAVPLGVKINDVSLNDSDITVRDQSIIPVAPNNLNTPGWYRIMTNTNVGTEFTGILNITRSYYNTFPETYQISLSYDYYTSKAGIKAVMINKQVRSAGITKIRFIRSGQSNAHIEIYYSLDKNNAVTATMTNFCGAKSGCKWKSAGFAAGEIPDGYLCDEVDLTTPDLQSQIDKIATEGCVMQRIAAYTNLDTMTTQGDYYSLNSSDTASLVNCPFSGSGGKIKVETITPIFVMQTAIKGWSGTTPSISVRGGQLTSGVWNFSPWYMVGLTPMV